ncbi:cytochrome P450 [Spinellus fusiger]|nr:cytochrome P450 [Spinellus fusiger]KAI7865739.1 cytochrome P450 [Spinellus fusiger]
MGVQDTVFISDPSIAHKVFNTNGGVTTMRPTNNFTSEYYSINGRGMIFAKDKKKLKESRLAANMFLVPKVLDQMGDIITIETSYLVDRLIRNGNTDEGVNPFNDLTFRSLNVMTKVCLGIRLESTDDPVFMNILEIIHLSFMYSGLDETIDAYIPALWFIGYFQKKDTQKREFIANLRDPTMKKLIAQSIEEDNDCLVKRMRKSDNNNMYDEEDIMVLVCDLLVAGTDTVTLSISWAFVALSRYPEVQQKICAEIDAFITKHKKLPTFADREAFPYTISVQREIMRFYPLTPYGNPHVAEQDFTVNNYRIKKGTTLVSDMYSMHRNPDVYSDPDRFIPERFINNKSTFHASANGNTKDRDQFNFGWGRRICPGIYLAEMEIFQTYINVWARSTVEPALDSNGDPVYGDIEGFIDGGIAIIPKPYKVRFVERPDRLI